MFSYNLSAAQTLRKSMLKIDATSLINSTISMQDCTVYSRVGFRGLGTESFLMSQGFPIPSQPNQSLRNEEGIAVLRLSNTEFWLLDTNNTHHEKIELLELAAQGLNDVYRLFCQHSHACFVITGEKTSSMFSKVCGVDLRDSVFPIGSIAQTSVARINAIVTRQVEDGREYFLLCADLASAQYLWEALADAAAEFV